MRFAMGERDWRREPGRECECESPTLGKFRGHDTSLHIVHCALSRAAYTYRPTMLVLYETAMGFALFKLTDSAKLTDPDLYKEFETPERANGLCV